MKNRRVKRRSLTREELFPKREERLMKFILEREFSDPDERLAYMKALIKEMEK